jgi:hypothetical protein
VCPRFEYGAAGSSFENRTGYCAREINMQNVSLNQLIPVLQVAIGPVILISGVGLLLLTMTNRLARTVDRARILSRELKESHASDAQQISEQIEMIFRRARMLKLAITLAGLSALFAALLIVTLFLTALFQWQTGVVVAALFMGCMASLVGSLVAFLMDVHWALAALEVELRREH